MIFFCSHDFIEQAVYRQISGFVSTFISNKEIDLRRTFGFMRVFYPGICLQSNLFVGSCSNWQGDV